MGMRVDLASNQACSREGVVDSINREDRVKAQAQISSQA